MVTKQKNGVNKLNILIAVGVLVVLGLLFFNSGITGNVIAGDDEALNDEAYSSCQGSSTYAGFSTCFSEYESTSDAESGSEAYPVDTTTEDSSTSVFGAMFAFFFGPGADSTTETLADEPKDTGIDTINDVADTDDNTCNDHPDCTNPNFPHCLSGMCYECSSDRDCGIGFDCNTGVCVPGIPNCVSDDDCSFSGNCESGFCGDPICGNNICASLEDSSTCPEDCGVDTGGSCLNNDDCASGNCDFNACGDPICRDDICHEFEDSITCPEDCGELNGGSCVNNDDCGSEKCESGICVVNEPPVVNNLCGNNLCDNGEDSSTCPEDCRIVLV
jgi:hypothetical protein